MKRLWAVLLGVVLTQAAFGYNKTMYPYTLPAGKQGAALGCVEAKPGMKLELGKWYTNMEVCKKYADDNGLPLLAVWSNEGCVHCWYFDVCLVQPEFVAWQKTSNAGKVICCFMAGGDSTVPAGDREGSSWYNWMWKTGGPALNAYPFVVVWWKKGGVNYRTTGDDICAKDNGAIFSFAESTIPERVPQVIKRLENALKNWVPPADYSGGTFADPNTAENRLEAEAGTKSVSVTLVREDNVKDVATNNTLVVKSPTGATLATQKITWTKGQVSQSVTIDLTKAGFTKDGQKVTLQLDDTKKSTLDITYVVKANSAANPKWLGESFGFGEWTMDLDQAKTQTKNASGKAYTLIAVQGSLWCPDCGNTERNFLELKNESGANRFAAWAKTKNVNLVAVDIPNYTGAGEADFATPSLLSKTAYGTKLVRDREGDNPALNGGAQADTAEIVRSGLGYLTRKSITAAAAEAQLKKFHTLVTTNTDKGGVHRPEDANKNRTGVPIFVLLRQDGTVAARFTTFASASPMKYDTTGKEIASANFATTIARFEEMLTIADDPTAKGTAEIENNFPGAGSTAFAANGGTAVGELSFTDTVDTFKLDGIGGNALQQVTVSGESAVTVKVEFVKADGTSLASAEGTLSAGVTLNHTFTAKGDYYVKVSSTAISSGFHAFTLTGNVVLVPQTDKATGAAPATSETVMLRLVKDTVYRLEGVKVAAVGGILKPADPSDQFCKFFTALVDGDKAITLSGGKGASLQYQIWKPGTIGFETTSRTVTESICDKDGQPLKIAITRTDGTSGSVTVRVALDEKTTLATNRFVFATTDLTWADGERTTKTVDVMILDDLLYDGSGKVILSLEVLSSDNRDATIGEGKDIYALTVNEDDVQSPGKISFTGAADPVVARAMTVYAKPSKGAKLYVTRTNGNDGLVGVSVKSSVSGVKFATENPRDFEDGILWWSHREGGAKALAVTGLPAGKTARITLTAKSDAKVVSTASAFTVISVAEDAPEFKESTAEFDALRYLAVSNVYALATEPKGRVTFTKLSGTLPAGLKVAYDPTANAMAVFGATTAKPGVSTVTYQVKDGTTAGLVLALTITVKDPTDAKVDPTFANAAVAKTRTLTNLPVINAPEKRLAGLLQVTIPTRGNVSARYTSADGVVSLTAKAWSAFDVETKALTAELTSTKGVTMTVIVAADGGVTCALIDPDYEEGVQLDAETDGFVWSKAESAADWKGYYTAALPVDATTVDEDREGFAPRGKGYLTLKMDTDAAANAGRVTWAGLLPNGTAVSGSSVLIKGKDWAMLSLFSRSTTDAFAAMPKILKNAKASAERRCVLADESVVPYWVHGERDLEAEADYLVDMDVLGSYYDVTEDLGACCEEYYETKTPLLTFDTSTIGETASGKPVMPEIAETLVDEKSIKLSGKPTHVTLSLNRATGVVSGTVKLSCNDTGKTISAKWKGVIVTGWGEGCGCGPGGDDVFLPFVNGSYFFTDRLEYETTVGTRTVKKSLSVKRGGAAQIEPSADAAKTSARCSPCQP